MVELTSHRSRASPISNSMVPIQRSYYPESPRRSRSRSPILSRSPKSSGSPPVIHSKYEEQMASGRSSTFTIKHEEQERGDVVSHLRSRDLFKIGISII